MQPTNSQVSGRLVSAKMASTELDLWRAPWPDILKFYADIGIDLSPLDMKSGRDCRLVLPEDFFCEHAKVKWRTIPFYRLEGDAVASHHVHDILALRRRILRILGVLIVFSLRDLSSPMRKRRYSGYSWSTWRSDALALLEIGRVALLCRGSAERKGDCPDGLQVFSIPTHELYKFAKHRRVIYSLNVRVREVYALGLIDDWFDCELKEWSYEEMRIELAKKTGRPLKPRGQNEFEPFSDDDLVVILRIALEMSDLTDDLVVLQEEVCRIRASLKSCSPSWGKVKAASEFRGLLSEFRGTRVRMH